MQAYADRPCVQFAFQRLLPYSTVNHFGGGRSTVVAASDMPG